MLQVKTSNYLSSNKLRIPMGSHLFDNSSIPTACAHLSTHQTQFLKDEDPLWPLPVIDTQD
jgi:hypothetical protein